jgi:hypothetical protein
MTVTTCRAAIPTLCRIHGTGAAGVTLDAVRNYHEARNHVAQETDVDRRYKAQERLDEATTAYAATIAGQEEFAAALESTTDWAERQKLEQIIADGEARREVIESKIPGQTTFPASKIEEAVNRIEKANRKLERAGVEERFTYTIEQFVEEDNEGHAYQMAALNLSHPTIKSGDWSFVAAVDKTGDSLITRTLPSQELNGYRPEQFKCDHCQSNRFRKSTYLLRNEEGEYKQVGSNCLESFTGVKPKALWALDYDPDEEENNYLNSGTRNWGGADSRLKTSELVAAALALSNNGENYRSQNTANEYGGVSTTSEVRRYFFPPAPMMVNGRTIDTSPTVDHMDYHEQAQRLIQETRFEGNSDYEANMRELMSQEYTSIKHMGFVTSVVAAARRNQARAERTAAPRSVGYLGVAGDKLRDVTLTVKKVHHSYGSMNGREYSSTLLIMADENGKEVKWSASGTRNYAKDDTLLIKSATIKELGEFNGNQQTIITRARVDETSS